jgi:carbon storage regulator CsrA
MLILNRYAGETLVLGGNSFVKVLEVRPDGRVTIGIDAPREIEIDRLEIYNRNKKSGRQVKGAIDKS